MPAVLGGIATICALRNGDKVVELVSNDHIVGLGVKPYSSPGIRAGRSEWTLPGKGSFSELGGPPHLGSCFLANTLENLRENLESATMASEKTTCKRLKINF